MSIKKTVLNGIARSSERAVKEATNSKSIWIYFEPEMPQKLKDKKMNDNK
ncbi:MAG: cyclic lactone autoinducer peptide [Candidatus Cellulosilyticum pullistercoris]|uniref:Cyclic lactone autoinducer peptide n=1 Tax=Candidatus Cellulosilyticum pullistercoris TaxID=2838521 RepID=A0A9E2KAS9_9FIRM|nr:cyclic lactone autoinducer peptide [Candidatus Cellulosilyticum pullistercoris]